MTGYRGFVGLLLLLLVGLQYRLWVGEGSLAHVDHLQGAVSIAAANNEMKAQRNEILKAEIFDLKNGHAAIEEKARVDWGLIKQNETFYLLVDQVK